MGHSSRDLDRRSGGSRVQRATQSTRFPWCAKSRMALTRAPAFPPPLPEGTSLVCSAGAQGLSDEEVASALGLPPELRAQPGS